MGDWTQNLQEAIDFIEAHLTDELDIREIAARAYLSPYYFQRVFHALCSVSVAEYVRNRRMTLAAEALAAGDARVIDVALAYGYDSPDSFARAFQRFHGVSPSAALRGGVSLRTCAPLKLNLSREGGSMLEYRIETKPQFAVVGVSRMFNPETSYREIPVFWQEVMHRADVPVCGTFGVCLDENGQDGEFEYTIADLYRPQCDVPEACRIRVIPANTWAIFPCRGALPDALQSVNTRIWSEWLPGSKTWKMAGSYNLEVYTPMTERPEDTYTEIWVPVERA